MVLPELLREIENRGVTLVPAGDRLRFRPKRNLTPELVEGLRQHKTEILERLEGLESDERSSIPEGGERSRDPLLNSPVIRDVGEVLELARARLGDIAPEHRMDAPYPEPEGNGDPLVHRHTAKARFFRDVRRRDRERREREGLPPWIRVVDGGGDAA